MNEYYLEIAQIILLLLIFLSVQKNFIKTLRLLGKRTVVVLVYNLSKLVPKKKNLIVFGGENGQGFRGNTRYLFLEIVKDKRLHVVWITKNPEVVKLIRGLGYEAHLASSKKGMLYQLRARVIIHSHSINDDFIKSLLGGAISLNTWHGVGLKKVWGANKGTFSYKILHESKGLRKFFGKMVVRANHAKINYVISTSPAVTSYYPETFLVPKENIFELGQARNDVFFEESEEDKEIPEWIRNGKIIMYMPTHRKHGKLDTDINLVLDFKRLNDFCEKTGYKFLVKRHMYSSGEVPKTYKNIIDISSSPYDPQMLLKYTDILVTDYSSAYTDYLLLDRPVLFYCYDLNTYLTKSNEMYHNYFDVTPGPKAFKFNAFLKDLEDATRNPDLYREERKRVLDIFYSKENQGKVLQKQADFIYDHLLNLKREG